MRRPLWPVMRVNPWVPLIMAATAVSLPQLSTVVAEDRISSGPRHCDWHHRPDPDLYGVGVHSADDKGDLAEFSGCGHCRRQDRGLCRSPQLLSSLRKCLASIVIMMAGGVVFVINGLFAAQAAHLDLANSPAEGWKLLIADTGPVKVSD